MQRQIETCTDIKWNLQWHQLTCALTQTETHGATNRSVEWLNLKNAVTNWKKCCDINRNMHVRQLEHVTSLTEYHLVEEFLPVATWCPNLDYAITKLRPWAYRELSNPKSSRLWMRLSFHSHPSLPNSLFHLRVEARIVYASGIFFRMRAVCFAYYWPSFIRTIFLIQISLIPTCHPTRSYPSCRTCSVLVVFCRCPITKNAVVAWLRTDKCSSFRSGPNWPIIIISCDFFLGGGNWQSFWSKYIMWRWVCEWWMEFDGKRPWPVFVYPTQTPRIFVETIPPLCPIKETSDLLNW
jgi:hypothetical protein